MEQTLTNESMNQNNKSKIDPRLHENSVFHKEEKIKYSINGLRKTSSPFSKNKIRSLPHSLHKSKIHIG